VGQAGGALAHYGKWYTNSDCHDGQDRAGNLKLSTKPTRALETPQAEQDTGKTTWQNRVCFICMLIVVPSSLLLTGTFCGTGQHATRVIC
jgi:hypothetical protein